MMFDINFKFCAPYRFRAILVWMCFACYPFMLWCKAHKCTKTCTLPLVKKVVCKLFAAFQRRTGCEVNNKTKLHIHNLCHTRDQNEDFPITLFAGRKLGRKNEGRTDVDEVAKNEPETTSVLLACSGPTVGNSNDSNPFIHATGNRHPCCVVTGGSWNRWHCVPPHNGDTKMWNYSQLFLCVSPRFMHVQGQTVCIMLLLSIVLRLSGQKGQ